MQPEVTTQSVTDIEQLAKVVQELSLARNIQTVMKVVRRAARLLTGADGATFILREGECCYYADEDAISPLWKGSRFPMNTCISGWVMLNKKPAVIKDIYTDDRIPQNAYRATFVKSLAVVPIRTKDPIGAIGNYWARNYTPTPTELTLLQSLANITSVTLENIRAYDELERKVAERTEELEESNKELEAFSYSVSHDLQAPLRAINGYLTMLNENHFNGLDEEGKRITDRVMINAQKMAQLINDLLSFFKTGKKELIKTQASMRMITNSVCEDLKQENKTMNTEITIGELPDAIADAALIRQVWANLISNAIKYSSKQKHPKVEIGATHHSDKKTVVYYVKDNGAGFNMQFYDKLFGVFQRLHSPQEFEGTGIGLAIVQKIVERHSGKVWADSAEGKGASFYFTLGKGEH